VFAAPVSWVETSGVMCSPLFPARSVGLLLDCEGYETGKAACRSRGPAADSYGVRSFARDITSVVKSISATSARMVTVIASWRDIHCLSRMPERAASRRFLEGTLIWVGGGETQVLATRVASREQITAGRVCLADQAARMVEVGRLYRG
jgi:hypothetical protein